MPKINPATARLGQRGTTTMSTTPSTTTEPTAILTGTAIIVSTSSVPSVQSPAEQPEAVILSPEELAVALSHTPQAPNVTVDVPASTEPDADLNLQLNNFAAQLPASAASGSAQVGKQDEQLCEVAKHAILRYYGASIVAEYLQGKFLVLLQKERAKPGSGTFVADLDQLRKAGALGLSDATAYRRIARYKAVRNGLADLLPIRLSQDEKDTWGLEEVSVDCFEEALERNSGDAHTKAYNSLIEEVAELEKQRRKQTGDITTFNMQLFGLSDDEKKSFRAAFEKLVETHSNDKSAASKSLVGMVCSIMQNIKAVAA